MGFPKMRVPKMNSLFFYFYFFFSAGPFLVLRLPRLTPFPLWGSVAAVAGARGGGWGQCQGHPPGCPRGGGVGGGGNPVLAQGRGGRTLGFIMENPIKMDDLLL